MLRYLKSHIALIEFNDIINEKSTSNFLKSLSKLEAHKKRIKGIAFTVDSRGGSIVHSQKIYDYLNCYSKENNIEVHSYAKSVAASGGYFLLSSGSKIYARKDSLIGSIGVISTQTNFHSILKSLYLDNKVFITSYIEKNNKYEDITRYLDSSKEMTVEELQKGKEIIEEIIKLMHLVFKNHVLYSRE